jgi:hypothetical protein
MLVQMHQRLLSTSAYKHLFDQIAGNSFKYKTKSEIVNIIKNTRSHTEYERQFHKLGENGFMGVLEGTRCFGGEVTLLSGHARHESYFHMK